MNSTTLTIVDGVRIVVPDSLNLITPYVLQEQQDWFEDEIKFLRRLLQPGQKVIDIGANYGVYTLSMARTVGPTGCVWAFEPASSTAKLLAEGISLNGFAHVVLEQSALSSSCGTSQLSLNQNSELNALVHGNASTDTCETVPLVTLDECLSRYGWHSIDFIKIDAEGEEANILKGGKRFFTELSPLVQYEIKAGENLHFSLVQDFAALGYHSYRLVPGTDLLIPFDAESPSDEFLLNLFCCKFDRAEQLAAQGFLLDSAAYLSSTGTTRLNNILANIQNHDTYDWRQTVAQLPYGMQLTNFWEQTMFEGNSSEVDEALFFYALSQSPSLSSTERFYALEASFKLLENICMNSPSYLRLASLARVARDYGARYIAVKALSQLYNILQHNQVNLSEPFLTPGKRFDSIPPGEAIGNWLLASVLEEFERLRSFSSFYTEASSLQLLETIRTLGFGSEEMERRLHLHQQRSALLPASS